MKYLKKFESQDNLEEELLEYFIDMDKNYGGRWDVSVECLPPLHHTLDFYRIRIESKSGSNIDFRDFLVEFSARVKMAISMGNFKLHYHDYGAKKGEVTTTPPNFGTYDLEAATNHGTHFARIPMTKETYDDINAIVKRYQFPSGKRYYVKEGAVVKFNRLTIFFSQV